MYNRIIKGALEPLKNINKNINIGKNHIHISLGYRNEKILQKQDLFFNDNIVKIKNESARKMLKLINLRNSYSGKNKLNYISIFIKSEKIKYPGNVFVIRIGDKYESFEEDSILLVEHCGLKFNGETPHVQFETSELRDVIKKMNEAGITVNVYEELVKSDLLSDEQKTYNLSNIYKPDTHEKEGCELNLGESPYKDDSDNVSVEIIRNSKENKIIGLGYEEDGYIMSVLELNGRVDRYYNLNEICVTDMINRLNGRIIILQDYSSKIKTVFKNLTNVIHYHVMQGSYVGENFHKSFMQEIVNRLNLNIDFNINYLVSGSKRVENEDRNIGSYLDNGIISYLGDFYEKVVFSNSFDYVKKYFKKLLYKCELTQSSKIREINEILSELTVPLTQIKSVYSNSSTVNKSMNVNHVENLISNLNVFKNYDEILPSRLNELVFELVKKELNIEFNENNLLKQYKKLIRTMKTYVNNEYNNEEPKRSNHLISNLRDRKKIKNIIKKELIINQINRVEESYNKLINEIHKKFVDSSEVEHVKINENDMKHINISSSSNIIYSKQLGSKVNHVNLDTIQVIENNKLINCYISKEVNLSMSKYINECEILNYKMEEVANKLQLAINPYKQMIEIITHYLIIIQSLNEHVRYAISNGWNLLRPNEGFETKNNGGVHGKSNKISNSSILANEVNLVSDDKKVLLAILLSNLGLYAPCDGNSRVLMYNKFYLLSNNKGTYMRTVIESSDKNTLIVFKSKPSDEVAVELLKNKSTVIVQDQDNLVDGNSSRSQVKKESSVTREEIYRMTRKINNPKLREKIKVIIKFLDNIVTFKANTDLVYLCKNNVPPPRFSQMPLVYVIFMNLKHSTGEDIRNINNTSNSVSVDNYINANGLNKISKFNRNKMVVYVGETGDITTRLNKHKSRTNLNLNEYMQNQFMDYNSQLNQYLEHINGYTNKCSENKFKYEIDFDNMSILLLRLKSRKECKIVENKLIQQLFNCPDLFIVLSHRDGRECTIPYVD